MEWKELAPDVFKAAVIGGLALLWRVGSKKGKVYYFAVKRIIRNSQEIDDLILNAQYRQAFFHIARTPIYIIDCASGDVVYVNRAWLELFGFRNEEDAKYKGWMQAIPDEEVDETFRENERFMRNPTNSSGERDFRHIGTGEKITCRYWNQVIHDRRNKPIKAMGVLEVI